MGGRMSTDVRLMELLDAELDGILDAAGATELAGRLAAEPEARAARAQLQKMHAALAGLPEQPVPEGLRNSVLSRMPVPPAAVEEPVTNLSGPGRYSIAWPRRAHRARHSQAAHQPATHPHTSRPTMKRSKILAFGVVATAISAVLYFGVVHDQVKPGDTFGTIAPAQRYQAATVGADDVKLGD
jgi:anti-sigma factor RsiW